MSQWPQTPLGELAANVQYACIGGPFGSELTTRDYVDSPGVPVIRGSNLREDGFLDDGFVYVSEPKAEALRANQARPGDIVFTQRGTIGQIALIPQAARHKCYVLSQSQMKLTPDLSRLEPRFLLHYFRSPAALGFLTQNTLATGVPHINLTILRRAPVPVPPLPEQRRIAAILDKADALRGKRRAALAQLDTLTQFIFLDMFGNPATNPKGWERVQLVNLCDGSDDIRCGPFGTQLAKREYTYAGVPLWGIKSVNASFSLPTDEFLESHTAERLAPYSIEPGDIVMTRKGTIGNCAVYPAEFPVGIMHSDLLRLRTSANKCEPVFVAHQLHYSRDVERQLALISGGAVMPGINVSKLKNLEVLVPPIEAQREFANRVAAVDKVKSSHRASQAKLNLLFASLQYRAFQGEL